ncbi:MAG TPA: hypothetical protein VLB82_05485 [Thermodesulfobacteriota bacterium]|nr:hypothetical protein [Thermodesulfobacteriota bacterium]
MEKFKLEYFKNDFPNEDFPYYREIVGEELSKLRERFCNSFGLSHELTPADMNKLTYELAKHYYELDNPITNNNDWKKIILYSGINIKDDDRVLIKWEEYGKIDEMIFKDVCKYLYFIWYEPSEEIGLFDNSCEWIIYFFHYGGVRYYNKSEG